MFGKPWRLALLVTISFTSVLWTAGDPATAKGSIDRITLTDPAGHVIEVTSGAALQTFSPWGMAFVDGELAEPPAIDEAFRVDLFLKTADGSMTRIYTFDYYPSSSQGGVIYLPGPGEPDYSMNISTILSSDGSWHNGRWHRASAEWVSFAESLMRITPLTTGDGGLR